MNDHPRQTLCDLVRRFGTQIGEDSKRCVALLRDTCGAHKAEIHALASAVEERVPQELASDSQATPTTVLIGRLVGRLRQHSALSDEAAAWAVHSWALALGVVSSQEFAALEARSNALRQTQAASAEETQTSDRQSAANQPNNLDGAIPASSRKPKSSSRTRPPTSPLADALHDDVQDNVPLPPAQGVSPLPPPQRLPPAHVQAGGHLPPRVAINVIVPPAAQVREEPFGFVKAATVIVANFFVIGLFTTIAAVAMELILTAIAKNTAEASKPENVWVAPTVAALVWGILGFIATFISTLIAVSRVSRFGVLSLLFWLAALTMVFIAAGLVPALVLAADYGADVQSHQGFRLFSSALIVGAGAISITVYQLGCGPTGSGRPIGCLASVLALILLLVDLGASAGWVYSRWDKLKQIGPKPSAENAVSAEATAETSRQVALSRDA